LAPFTLKATAASKLWVDKIIEYLNGDERQSGKMISWIKELYPEIKERSIEIEIERELIEAFKQI
jgi:hypothetical protein